VTVRKVEGDAFAAALTAAITAARGRRSVMSFIVVGSEEGLKVV
jgi:hypothetical protein